MDSLRFLTMRLKDMPKTFGVEEVKNGFFPYRLNNRKYWDKVIALPTKEDFEMQFMNSKEKAEFEQWYTQNIHKVYMQIQQEYENGLRKDDLWYYIFEENRTYCRDDVRVLRLCFMKFFDACRTTTQIMPEVNNMTIASYCNKVWRTHHLEKDTVGLVPHKGYLQKDVQSKMAKTWLAFLDTCYLEGKLQYAGKDAGEKKISILWGLYKGYLQKDVQSKMAKTWLAFLDTCYLEGKLQYAGKDAGEKKISILMGLYKVDGYLAEENAVYEFLGCYFHGCPRCTNASSNSIGAGMEMGDLYTMTMNRLAVLRAAGFKLHTIWECAWKTPKQKPCTSVLSPMTCLFSASLWTQATLSSVGVWTAIS